MTDTDSKAVNLIESHPAFEIKSLRLPYYNIMHAAQVAMPSVRSSLPLLTGCLALAPESSDNSTLCEHLLTLRTRANNVRSLFSDKFCNFSANSWAEDQRDASELGFYAGRVAWVDPSSI